MVTGFDFAQQMAFQSMNQCFKDNGKNLKVPYLEYVL